LLICSTHGALYDPATGACRGGPCRGNGLIPVPVVERDGTIHIEE
ncbi:MAG: Rieske (2Fe-2S) protein, partial [Betaproteobacteria bacterium]|nr:Rieske (2Fe-2S) protein [Betaproteobacteria bacterium]